ncbi:ABC transporter permease [Martelella mediterranea]|uniref:ABC transporter permease n=1 Tax=Martelella mediterranea TaxID=293089 RepID=UPI001E63FF7F|nr:ABC transporter permease [Martelella mediterranea]MCD1635801.1 ABC transporter permease [Martelella mediterranea]
MKNMRSVKSHEAGLVLATIVCFVIFSVTAPNFLTTINQVNILRQAAFTGIIALGMTWVIIAGEIDISVGATVALTSALIGVLTRDLGIDIVAALIIVLITGTIVGLFAGAVRAYLGIPSIIVTLALFLSLRGIAEYITDASPISVYNPVLDFLSGNFLGLPLPVLIFLLLAVIFWIVSRQMVFGRQIYSVGSNAKASQIAGLPVARVRVLVFTATGFLASITGVLLTARIGSGTSAIGNGLEFEVIAAVIIGGTLLTGGRGSIIGTLLGVFFISILGNALVLYGVNSYAQNIVRGAVVLLAVFITNLQAGKLGANE